MTAVDSRRGQRPCRSARAPPRSARQAVAGYVALTKPRIIELLLVTTVPTMLLAEGGVPSLRLVAATLVGGALAAGSANTLNCYLDRDIDQVMHRTERRPLATGLVSPREALVFGARARGGLGRLALGDHRLAARGARAGGDRLLRRGVHDGAQAPDPAEHRVGRRRGLHAGADRLVGRHRLAGLDAGGPVRRDLLLDAAALLAAVDALPRRLRRGRRADAAGRRRQRRRRPADRRLQLGDGGDLAAALAGRRHHPGLRRGRAGPRRCVPARGAPPAAPGPARGRRVAR